ncbi:ABC transporter ATP-binding protein [Tessaracoccus flavescens]|uniref:ABC transporter ATP-binding protein n=1 Tax=Tessaracoccus flavescens TaxID=399497 RepID=UPI0026945A90
MNANQHAFVAEAITVGYDGRVVISDLDFAVPAGKVTVIVGPNACGKSTLLRSMAGLHPLTAGSVLLDGSSIEQLGRKRVARTVGVLPQSSIAPDGVRVAELVARGRYPHQGWFGLVRSDDDLVVAKALADTGTADLADRRVDELSGGQRQRVWIAMVLAQATDIVLLDEPTTYLDVTHQLDLLDLLAELNHERGTTVVMVLHELNPGRPLRRPPRHDARRGDRRAGRPFGHRHHRIHPPRVRARLPGRPRSRLRHAARRAHRATPRRLTNHPHTVRNQGEPPCAQSCQQPRSPWRSR